MADRSPDRHGESTLRRIMQGTEQRLLARLDDLEKRIKALEKKSD